MPTPRRLIPVAAFAAGILLLAGCATAAPGPEGSALPTAPTAEATATTGPSEPSPTPTSAPTEVSCESIISTDTAAQLAAQGWTAKESPLVVGTTTVSDGLSCMWADFAVPSGALLIFGWGPIDDADAVAAQNELLAQGWMREEGTEGTYITEDPMQAPTTDVDGYGMTYLFGDGWGTVADTKQGLLLINRP